MNSQQVQIWNNAAFDYDNLDGQTAAAMISGSWSPLKPVFVSSSGSNGSDSSKENRIPAIRKSPLSGGTRGVTKPLQPNFSIGNQSLKIECEETSRDEHAIDAEIDGVELEICRLLSRLETLRFEKGKIVQRCGSPKFSKDDKAKKFEDSLGSNKKASPRRTVRMGPSEILAVGENAKTKRTEIAGMQPSNSKKTRTITTRPSEFLAGGKTSTLRKAEMVPSDKMKISRRAVSMGPSEILSGGKIPATRRAQITEAQLGNTKKIPRNMPHSEVITGGKIPATGKEIAAAQKSRTKKAPTRTLSMGPSEILAGRKISAPRITEITGAQAGNDKNSRSMGQSKIIPGKKLPATITEITAAQSKRTPRRPVSMGPMEIVAGAMTPLTRKAEITPIQNRRKSSFWKLEDINEDETLSASPETQPVSSKILKPKHATTKKEDPQKLFDDPQRNTRVVASRYHTNSAMRKSLPEAETGGLQKKRASSVGKVGDSARVSKAKKKWEIPSKVLIIHGDGESPSPTTKMVDLLPSIQTRRSQFSSPRDSGPAKRVSELTGKRSFFCTEEMRKELDFAEGADEEGVIYKNE